MLYLTAKIEGQKVKNVFETVDAQGSFLAFVYAHYKIAANLRLP